VRTTKPPGAATPVSAPEHIAAHANILQANAYRPGAPLTPDPSALREIGFGE
jgi:hypothetical protein